MSEKIFHETLSKLETIYSNLIKGDTSLEQEIEYRIALIDIISTLEASIINKKEQNKEFIELLAKVRDPLMNWDPYGHWFRQQKPLVDSIYNIIVNAKGVVFTTGADESSSETSRLKQELDSLRSEITELRQLMGDLIKAKKQTIDTSIQKQEKSISPPVEEESSPKEKAPSQTPPSSRSSIEPTVSSHDSQSQSLSDKAEIEESLAIIDGLMDSQERQPSDDYLTPEKTTKDETVVEPPPSQTSELDQMLPQEPQKTQSVSPPKIPTDSAEEDDTSLATSTITKLSKTGRDSTGKVLTQMKSIIQQAEEETERQISSFKDEMKQKTQTTEKKAPPPPSTQTVETPIVPPIVREAEPIEQASPIEDEQKEDSWVKPSEVLKQKATQEKEQTSTDSDPYMQLLTLEAEKYRLEKELEKNETAFQEGTKNKQEFDNTIQQINQELSIVREKIASLRKQLTS